MEVIQFTSLNDQRSGMIFGLVFLVAVGAILGGVWEQSASRSRSFWPRSFKRIIALSVVAAALGGVWGYFSSLNKVYQLECRGDSIVFWKAVWSQPRAIKKTDIIKVTPGLDSGRGSSWEIHIYESSGRVHSSPAIDERTMKKYIRQINECLVGKDRDVRPTRGSVDGQ